MLLNAVLTYISVYVHRSLTNLWCRPVRCHHGPRILWCMTHQLMNQGNWLIPDKLCRIISQLSVCTCLLHQLECVVQSERYLPWPYRNLLNNGDWHTTTLPTTERFYRRYVSTGPPLPPILGSLYFEVVIFMYKEPTCLLGCSPSQPHSQASRSSSYKPMGEDPAPTKGDSDKQSDRRECVKVTLPAKTMTVLGSDHPLFLCDWPVLGDLIMTWECSRVSTKAAAILGTDPAWATTPSLSVIHNVAKHTARCSV